MAFIDNIFFVPEIIPVFNCPACQKTVRLKTQTSLMEILCPFCNRRFNLLETQQSVFINSFITQGIISGNKFITMSPLIGFYLFLSLAFACFSLNYVFAFFLVLPFLFPIWFGGIWLRRFGNLEVSELKISQVTENQVNLQEISHQIIDQDFLQTVRKVKRSLLFWLGVHLFHLALWAYLLLR